MVAGGRWGVQTDGMMSRMLQWYFLQILLVRTCGKLLAKRLWQIVVDELVSRLLRDLSISLPIDWFI